jgi:hypothetical protein
VEQLRTLAANRNITMAELIGDFVREQVKLGNLADDVPGFIIFPKGDRLHFGIAGSNGTTLSLADAAKLAEQLEVAIAGKAGGYIDIDADWIVARVGTAIRIGTTTGETKTISRDIARDVLRVLRTALL